MGETIKSKETMKTIILILLAFTSYSQTLEIRSGEIYVIDSNVEYQNINWNGSNAKLIINPTATLVVNALNVNNNGTVINNGTLIVKGWIDLNNIKEFTSKGHIYASGMQNNTKVVANICGGLKVGTMQLNSAGIYSECCTLIEVDNLDINTDNAFSGQSHVIIGYINLNKVFSQDKNVTYLYNKKVNQPLLWGVASYYDSNRPKCDKPLPVTIDYFNITGFRFVDVRDVKYVEVEESLDAKNWKSINRINNVQENKTYKLR